MILISISLSRTMTMSPLLFIGLICLAGGGSLLPAEAIWLTIPSSGERCVYEMIQANVVVVGDYLCIDQDNVGFGPTIDIHVCLHRYQSLFTTILHILSKFSWLVIYIMHRLLYMLEMDRFIGLGYILIACGYIGNIT